MKAAKAWCVAGLFVLTGFSASCGKEEGTGNGGGGSGSILDGGEGGTSTAGTRMTGGSSGSGGSGGAVGQSKIGSGCVNDSQCEDPAAPGLICVTATDAVLGDGAPPKGLCTAECVLTPGEENPCAVYGNSLCYPYDSETGEGYCLEACSFGVPGIGEIKCHNRGEFSCHPALVADTEVGCADTDECDPGELCIDETCQAVLPACLPSCRGDLDCEPGMFCDQSFLNGVCVTEQPTGKALGEPCTIVPDDQPAEPDECIGFCQADSATGTTGRCQTACGIGNECGWNAATEEYDGVCLYASVLTVTVGDVGDFGFCSASCDCTGDCNDPELACTLLPTGELPDGFRGAGLCFSPNLPEAEGGGRDPDFVEYNQCTGAGGAGSTGEAGAASGGGGAGG